MQENKTTALLDSLRHAKTPRISISDVQPSAAHTEREQFGLELYSLFFLTRLCFFWLNSTLGKEKIKRKKKDLINNLIAQSGSAMPD